MQRLMPFLLIAVLSAAVAPAQADEPWQFQLAPYVWVAGMDGHVATLPGVPAATVNASFSDILENLDAAFMIAGEAHNGRIGLFGDILYVDIEATGSVPGPFNAPVRLEARTLYATAAGFWRLWSNDRASLDVMAGARFWSVDTELVIGAPISATVSHDEDWVDPLIGFKARGALGGGRFFHSVGVLFGGFDVGSDYMWDVFGNLGYQWTDGFSTSIGYRYLTVDYSNGGFSYDVVQEGPTVALIWRF